ncbi:MAG: hypothetical protein ACK5Q8_04305 [Phycisphaerales bacterium]
MTIDHPSCVVSSVDSKRDAQHVAIVRAATQTGLNTIEELRCGPADLCINALELG